VAESHRIDMKFYRILAAVVCATVVSAAIYWHVVPLNLCIGLLVGSIMFFICQSIDSINHAAIVFYGVMAIQIFVMRSLWAAVGYFFSPILAFGTYWLILLVARRGPKYEGIR
jgi:hypothetical protein